MGQSQGQSWSHPSKKLHPKAELFHEGTLKQWLRSSRTNFLCPGTGSLLRTFKVETFGLSDFFGVPTVSRSDVLRLMMTKQRSIGK
jgi:hypothetical protein